MEWPSPLIERPLGQHKEKRPQDPTVREKFNTYRFTGLKKGGREAALFRPVISSYQ